MAINNILIIYDLEQYLILKNRWFKIILNLNLK